MTPFGGACASRIKCTDCHDPHVAGPIGGAPDRSQHLRACLECHGDYCDAYARSPLGEGELPRLIRTLDDPVAVNRMFGLFAFERALGRRLTNAEYTPTGTPAVRREQVAKLLERFPQP